jgi:hypothetical protein
MALTLTEAAKLSTDTLQRGVIETFARTSAVLEQIPFMEIVGNAYLYNQEATLPRVAFRDVNEAYEESTATFNQKVAKLYIAGGDADVDRFHIQTKGNINDQRAIQTLALTKALSLAWTKQFFLGDSAVNPKGFDGLQTILDQGPESQVLTAGEDGAPLTITMLDELIDAVEGEPDVIYCSKAMRREIKKVIQNHNGYSESEYDAFGRPVMSYGGIQIRAIETDELGNEILGFNEVQGSAENTASIYAVKFGPEQYVSGLQNGGITVMDLGQLDERPVYRTRIEWFSSIAVFHPRAAARLKGIVKSSQA